MIVGSLTVFEFACEAVMGNTYSLALFGIGVLLVGFLVVIPIMAMILRGAASMANRVLGGGQPHQQPPQFEERTSGSSFDPDNPFAAPQTQTVVHANPNGVPVPGFGRALGIAFACVISNYVFRFAFAIVASRLVGAQAFFAIGSAVSLVINFLVWSFLHSWLLPTKFGRAALVVFFEGVIVVVLSIVFGGLLMMLATFTS